jgi:hypothetical protein
MSKVKYYYDSENLAYRKIKHEKRKLVVFFFLLAAVLFGFSFIILLNTPYFETPKIDCKHAKLKIWDWIMRYWTKMDQINGVINWRSRQ